MSRARNIAALDATVTDLTGSFPRAIAGLTLARETATNFSVSAGSAANENGTPSTVLMKRTASITKTLGAFSVGTGNGALDAGSVSSDTWYHVHLIRRDSDARIDVLLSTSATAPTMPTGWTNRRRIGSILTNGSSQIVAFSQIGDLFTWSVPVTDVNATNPGASAVTRALSVPSGVVVCPVVNWMVNNVTTASVALLVTALDQADTTPTATLCTLAGGGAAANSRSVAVVSSVATNTSRQVRTRISASGASDALVGVTLGWIDKRGA